MIASPPPLPLLTVGGLERKKMPQGSRLLFSRITAPTFFFVVSALYFVVRESKCVVGKGAPEKKFLIDDLRPSVNVVDGEEGSRCPSREKTAAEVFPK